jgi:chemotaxis protein MotB
MKRNHAAAHENHERWLVSYADFITLLFAFFVVMFASTQGDKKKAAEVSAAVRDALEHGQLSATLAGVLGRTRHPADAQGAQKSGSLPSSAGAGPHPADLAKSLETLEKSLAAEIASGKIDLTLERRGLVISLRESALFASGDDAVDSACLPALSKISAEIRDVPNKLRLEGHTDSVPIHNSRFRSNWELSAARSIAVMEVLHGNFGIPYARMSVAGYAENAPADTNDTGDGRAHNRRVDLVVLSEEAEMNEPKAASKGKTPNDAAKK